MNRPVILVFGISFVAHPIIFVNMQCGVVCTLGFQKVLRLTFTLLYIHVVCLECLITKCHSGEPLNSLHAF